MSTAKRQLRVVETLTQVGMADYAGAYPEQSADVSYGIGSVTLESETLVSSGAGLRFHVLLSPPCHPPCGDAARGVMLRCRHTHGGA